MPIPTLQTERLILRAHTRDDLSAATAMWSEPVVVRYIGGKPESGWAFAPHAFGKGYATEALKAALAWGDENLKPKKTVCIIGPENLASIRVAEKCGYQKQLETTYSGEPTLLFERIL